ncbi:tumor-associated calcium signal transducer 2 [Numida meleagris]|uniref:tumor-associated calcium signal transducer 2 n=1 Tax=Numida meleagris TaxID=8996 RepID=UPI000B3DE513|nr:tumor-associated calcium signal transducer 2 [Numida meleagris]
MELPLGVMLGLILMLTSSAQSCTCVTNKWTLCAQDASGSCTCKLVGSDRPVDCSRLTSKCLLMKAEMTAPKFSYRRQIKLLDGGIYNPDCEDSGIFKARQCDEAGTCWCVNTAGIRRTGKSDKNLICNELIRTNWVDIELKHKETSHYFEAPDVAEALKHLFENRYKLQPKYVTAVKYDSPFIQIHLKQNNLEQHDVDIVDVAYYLEKDVNNDSVFHSDSTLHVSVNGKALDIEKIRIYYVDEKPPVFSMKQLLGDVSAVVAAVILPAGFAIILGIMLWQRRKYRKMEVQNACETQGQAPQLL